MMTGDPGSDRNYQTPAVSAATTPMRVTSFRNSAYAVLASYIGIALLLLLNAAVTKTVAIPGWAYTYLLVLTPILTVGVKDLLRYIQTGEWQPPVFPMAKPPSK